MKLLIDGKWIGNQAEHERKRCEAIARYDKVKRLKQEEDKNNDSGDELHER